MPVPLPLRPPQTSPLLPSRPLSPHPNRAKLKRAADPALWGYLPPSAPGGPFTPSPAPDASPFQLLLIGQRNQKDPLVIPPELAQVVYILEDMLYPDFYEGLAIAVSHSVSCCFVLLFGAGLGAGAGRWKLDSERWKSPTLARRR